MRVTVTEGISPILIQTTRIVLARLSPNTLAYAIDHAHTDAPIPSDVRDELIAKAILGSNGTMFSAACEVILDTYDKDGHLI